MDTKIAISQSFSLRQVLLDRFLRRGLKARLTSQSLDDRHPRVVFANEFIGMETFLAGTYERNHLLILERVAKALQQYKTEVTFVDVGANIGVHTRFLSKSVGRVLSFEPNHEVLPILEYNTSDLKNVTIHALALSNHVGTAALSRSHTWNKGTASLEQPNSEGAVEVETATLDTWLAPNGSVDLIKLDVEGHELAVLTGAVATLSRCRPIVALEQRDEEFDGTGRETPSIRLLRSLGYELYSPSFYSPSFDTKRLVRVLGRLLNFVKLAAFRKRVWSLHLCQEVPRGLYPLLVAIPAEAASELALF